MSSKEVITVNKVPLNINLKVAEPEPESHPDDNIADEPVVDASPYSGMENFIQPQPLGDPEIRQGLIARIQAHFQSDVFGPELAHLNTDLSFHTVEQLENLMAQIQQVEGRGASSQLFRGVFYQGTDILESILIAKSKYKAQGWSQSLQANKDFQRSLERIRLKYFALLNAPPEVELGIIMMASLQGVHNYNTMAEAIAEQKAQLAQPVPSSIAAKAKDL